MTDHSPEVPEEDLVEDEAMASTLHDPEVTTVDKDPVIGVDDLSGDEEAYPRDGDEDAFGE